MGLKTCNSFEIKVKFSLFAKKIAYLQFFFVMMDIKTTIKYHLIVLFLFIASFGYAQEGEFRIAAIKVQGINTVDNGLVVSFSGLQVGQLISIPGEEIGGAIKNLWKQGIFSYVSIEAERYEKNNVFLVIKIEEKPRISRYKILGIKKGEIDDIRPKLDIRSGTILNDNIKTSIRNAIKEYYKEKAYIYPTIDIVQHPDTIVKNNVWLEIKINKGDKYLVNRIYFLDNKVAGSRALKKSMKENKESAYVDFTNMFKFKQNLNDSGWKWNDYIGGLSVVNIKNYASEFVNPNVFAGAKYNPMTLRLNDFRTIKDYYNSIGHKDAQINWDTTQITKDKKVNIYIKVDEGQRYYYRNLKWKGNTKYSDSILANILNIRKGDVYDSKKLDEKLQQSPDGGDIASLYMDDGYLFFSIEPVEIAVVGDSVDIEFKIYEGTQSTINRINIFGNDKTSEHVIRRELRIKPGDKFDRSKLIRTQREIMALNYFNPEKMQILPKPNQQDGSVDIDLILEEKPSDQLSLSLGYANALYGQVGVNFTNFSVRNITKPKYWKPLPSGDGQTLSINLQSTGLQSQFLNISFTEPWLGGKKPTSLTVSTYNSRINSLSGTTVLGRYIRTGGSVEVGTRLKWPDDYFVIFFGLTFDNNYLNNYNYFTGITNGNVNNFYGRLTLTRNSLQGPIGPQLYPSSGSNFSFSIQATPPYSSIFSSRNLNYNDPNLSNGDRWNWLEYHKWKFSMETYTPIVGNLVVKFSGAFGTLGSYNSAYGISPFERFRVGGDGLVAFNQYGQETYALRGYADNEVTINSEGQYISGNIVFNKFVTELRYPVSLNPQSTIYAMLFGEAGNGWATMTDYNPFQLKKSFGAGVRFYLPLFGLLGFDSGFGIDKAVPANLENGSFFDKYGKFRFILGFEPK